MTRDDMTIRYVFDAKKLNMGGCYKFKCGESGEKRGLLTHISEMILTFYTADHGLYAYDINATDFYNDPNSYIIELT